MLKKQTGKTTYVFTPVVLIYLFYSKVHTLVFLSSSGNSNMWPRLGTELGISKGCFPFKILWFYISLPLGSFANIIYQISCTRCFHKHLSKSSQHCEANISVSISQMSRPVKHREVNWYSSQASKEQSGLLVFFVPVHPTSKLLSQALTATTLMSSILFPAPTKLSTPICGLWINWKVTLGWSKEFTPTTVISLKNYRTPSPRDFAT